MRINLISVIEVSSYWILAYLSIFIYIYILIYLYLSIFLNLVFSLLLMDHVFVMILSSAKRRKELNKNNSGFFLAKEVINSDMKIRVQGRVMIQETRINITCSHRDRELVVDRSLPWRIVDTSQKLECPSTAKLLNSLKPCDQRLQSYKRSEMNLCALIWLRSHRYW